MATLLVLEDEPSDIVILREILKPDILVEASSAEQALQLFIEHDRKVDLLIADVTLPTSSGIQVALLLRSEIPDLPVILACDEQLSAWDDQHLAELNRLGAHMVAVLEKPLLQVDLRCLMKVGREI
jgi:CheY-like chemotaxis protein